MLFFHASPSPLCRFLQVTQTLFFAGTLFGLMTAQSFAATPRVKPPEHKQYYDQIALVNAKNHTVTVATMVQELDQHDHPVGYTDPRDHKKHIVPARTVSTVTLKVDTFTDIEVNDHKSTFAGLAKGMKVDVTKGLDDATAARLVIQQR